MNQEYWQLRSAGRNYYDAYRYATRINNRLKALARRGEFCPELDAQLEHAKADKEASGKIMTSLYRQVAPPRIVEFQKSTTGLGEVWVARLVGEVGDFCTFVEAWWEPGPEGSDEKRVLATGDVRSIGVRDLYAYCGHGDPARRRVKGGAQEDQFAAGSPLAKMITHQMAEFALRVNGVADKNGKARSMTPYYPLYTGERERMRSVHPDWTAGHNNNDAIRKVAKAILKDLWRVQHGQEPAYGAATPWVDRRVNAQPV